MESFDIIHESDRSRFVVETPSGTAEITYRLDDRILALTHTGVPKEEGGKGIAGQLTKAALDWARAQGYSVDPQCPYVAGYIKRHPEEADLLVRHLD